MIEFAALAGAPQAPAPKAEAAATTPKAPGRSVFSVTEGEASARQPADETVDSLLSDAALLQQAALPVKPGSAALRAALGLAPAEDLTEGEEAVVPLDAAETPQTPVALPVIDTTEQPLPMAEQQADLMPPAPEPAPQLSDRPIEIKTDRATDIPLPEKHALERPPAADAVMAAGRPEPEVAPAMEDTPEVTVKPEPPAKPLSSPKITLAGSQAEPGERSPQTSAPAPDAGVEQAFSAEMPEIERTPPEKTVTAPAPRAEPSALQRNLLDRLSEVQLEEGRSRFLLRPRGLGVVEIDLTRLVDGRMQVVLRLENPMVLDGLRAEAGQLGAWLEERGFDLGGSTPEFATWEGPEAEGEAGGDVPSETPSTLADPSAAAPLSADGRLNILT